MALYLHCAICSRKQAEGLLSGAAWGRVELPAGSSIEHPAVRGSKATCCPNCVGQYPDWQGRTMSSLGLVSGGGYGEPVPTPA